MILQLFAINDDKLINFTFNHANQVDEYGKSTGDFQIVQTKFDSRASELQTKHNALIDTIQALTGSLQMGHTSASITAQTVAQALEENRLATETKAPQGDTYTKAEVDAKDDALQVNITQEETARINADNVLAAAVSTKAEDSEVVHKTGNETINGDKTFVNNVNVPLTPTADTHAVSRKYVEDLAPLNIPDGSVKDVKLSDDSGQIKDKVAILEAKTITTEIVSVLDFGADNTGVTETSAEIQAAIDSLTTGGIVLLPIGTYLINTTLIDNSVTITLKGEGSSEVSGVTKILTTGAITGIRFDGNRSGVHDLIVEGDNGAFDGISHGIEVKSSRGILKNVVCQKHRGNGINFILGNAAYFEHVSCLLNKGHGFYVGDLIASIDVNACTFLSIDLRANSKSGLFLDTNGSFANNYYNVISQGNGEYGVYVNCDFNSFFGLYLEGNTTDELIFDSSSDGNRIYGVFSNTPAPYYTDLSTNQRNYIDTLKTFAEVVEAQSLEFGDKQTGLAGYVSLTDDGSDYVMSLEGTSASLNIKVKSSGAGTLGLDVEGDIDGTEAMQAPTLLNSWINQGGIRQVAGYYKDKFGVVHLRGIISSGVTTSPTILFNLPAGYRPSNREKFGTTANTLFASLFVDSDGNVYYESGSNVEFSLCGISFRTV